MQAYSFIDDLTGTPVTGYALRYALLPPSGQDSTSSGFTSYTDYVWLTVQDSYDIYYATPKRVTVYTDTISPGPTNWLFGSGLLLLAGRARRFRA